MGFLSSIGKALGAVAGSFIPIPGVGTAVGSAIGGAIGGALEGGSSATKVSQAATTTVNPTTNVNLNNTIDTKGLGDSLKTVMENQNQVTNELSRNQQVLQLLQTQTEARRVDVESSKAVIQQQQLSIANNTFRQVAVGGMTMTAIYLILRSRRK